MNRSTLKRAARALAAAAALVPFPAAAAAQREHLTPAEIELVRDNQALDARVGVFARAVERRLDLLANPQSVEKLSPKEAEKWGTLPKATRAQLLSDVARILDEAVTNIEDAAIHSEKSPLIPKAVRKLAEAGNRFLPRLTAMREGAQGDAERDALERAIESLNEVLDAAARLPEEEPPTTDKKKKKS